MSAASVSEVLIVDARLPDIEILLDNVRPDVETRLISGDDDGVAAIASALRDNPASVHVVAHGSAGKVLLGSAEFNLHRACELPRSASTLNLYACQAAANDAGQAFLTAIQTATGADVSAATSFFGHASQGGGWFLDVSTGGPRASSPFAPGIVHWPHVLAIIPGTPGDDTLNGTAGDDVITGGQGNDVMSGASGDDTFVYSSGNGSTIAGDGNDTIDGSDGTDTLRINRDTFNRNRFEIIATGDTSFTVGISNHTSPSHAVIAAESVETIDIDLADQGMVSLSGALVLEEVNVAGSAGSNRLDIAAMTSATQINAFLDAGDDSFYGGAQASGVNVDGGEGTDLADYSSADGSLDIDLDDGVAIRQDGEVTDIIFDFENATGGDHADTIRGTDGANVLRGNGGNDIIDGRDGDDEIYGGAGSDNISGGAGEDQIWGGGGSDTLNGGAGDDHIFGDAGNDTVNFTSGNGTTVAGGGNDVVDGGAGTDTLSVSRLTSGRNDIDVSASASGFDVEFRTLSGASPHTTVNTSNVEALKVAMANNERVSLNGNLAGLVTATITGSSGANTLSVATLASATAVNAQLAGGNDTFLGGAHATGVNVDGGAGTDHADYSGIAGPVTIDLGAGTAVRSGVTDAIRNFENATGTAGNDTIRGTTGRNVIDGGGGDDILIGLGGDDTIYGGTGNDTIYCGGGADVLIGGDGDDVYVIDGSVNIIEAPGGGIDTVRVGHTYVLHDGVDNVVVTGPIVGGGGGGVTITGHGGDNVFYSNGGGQVVVGNGNTFIGAGGTDTYYINGGDTVLTNGGRAIVYGAGSTTIIGGPGADDIECHGDGNDTITGGGGDDTLSGGDGNDTFLYTVGDGSDRIDGGGETGIVHPDVDRLIVTSDGDSRDFTIAKAGSGTDIVAGNNGDDVLVGYTGTGAAQSRMDEVEYIEINAAGGALNVTVGDLSGTAVIGRGIVVNSGGANDVVDVSGASGGRTVVFNDTDPVAAGDTDLARLSGSRSDYTISLANGVYSFLHNATGIVVLEARNVETFHFAGEGVTVGAGDLPITSGVGSSGNDIIRGTPGNDHIDGGDGDDIIYGGGGNDVLIGGNGNDTIYCGGGDDLLTGGDGDDLYVIDGSATIVELEDGGVDSVHTTQIYELHPGIENVRVIAGPSGTGGHGVTITGNGGNNTFFSLGGGGGSGGSNIFIGGGGVDTFYINGGDTVRTGGSHRVIVYGSGSTSIIGGDGDETIECEGSGNDTIRGGRGDDTIYGGDGDDTFLYTVGDGRDRIDGGTETGTAYPNFDRFIATSDAEARSFIISRAGSGSDIPAGVNATDVLFGYTGTDAAQSRMDEVEYIELNAADGGALNVTVGNLSDTALTQRAVVINSGEGNDVVDLTGASGGRTVVFNDSDVTSGGDTDLARLSGTRGDYTITITGGVYSFLHNVSGVVVLEATNVETFYFAGDGQTFTSENLLNTTPTAADDSAAITEDAVPGSTSGNVLTNDSANDPAPDMLTVTGAAAGNTNATLSGGVATVLNGSYGTLTIAADGSYTYTLDNTRFATNELTSGQVVHDIFSYTVSDSYGATSTAQVDVAVTGNDDGMPFNPTTQLVSSSATGLIGNGRSYAATISADGRYVTFHSAASNFVAGDTATPDIFIKDLITGSISKIAGTALAGPSTNPALNTATSEDGRWETFFVADSSSGVAGDTNAVYDVFARNVETGAVYLVSRGVSGGFANGESAFDANRLAVISADGRTIVYQSAATDIVTSDTNSALDVFAADNSDGIIVSGTSGNDTALNGTTQDDRIAGLAGSDTINAGAGNDRIWGDAGNDIVNAGDGDDTIFVAAGDGTDTIDGGAGYDTVRTTSGGVVINGNLLSSIERIDGGGHANVYIAVNGTLDLSAITLAGVEQIYGLDGNDTITGSAGNDTINGQLGTNTLNGGDGDDTFVYVYRRIGSPTVELMPVDTIDGGSGYDRLVGHTANAGIGITSISGVEEISANGFANVRILGSNNAETFDFTGVRAVNLTHTALHGGDDTVILGHTAGVGAGNGFGELAGGAGNDTFVIDGTGYRIFGGAHDGSAEAGFTDVIRARGDNAVIGLNHVEGIETITADGYSNVTIEGTSGNDTLNLGNVAIVGINSINLGAGTADYIAVNGTLDLSAITLTGVEQIYGLDGNDTITGSVGNDTINGQLGTNTLNGGDGDDTFVYVYRRIGSPTVELMPVDTIDGGSGYDRLVGHTANAGIGITSISGVEEISANGFANVRILGSNNAETFDFTGVRAVNLTHTALHGGDDTVILGHTAGVGAGNGFGELAGGAGNDTFVIDGIGYRIFGGAHDGSAEAGFTDVIRARGDNAVIGLNHVSGIETITADGYSNVTIEGTSGNDTLNLGNVAIVGINSINLGAGTADYIAVNGTLDLSAITLAGVEQIYGLDGNDTITGSAGNDTINGQLGTNTLNGGDGDDTFVYVYRRIGSPTVELMPVDTIDGGSGYDRLVGHTANAGIGITSISGVEEISANGFANVRILGSNNAETFDFTGVRAVNLTHTALHGGDDTVILGHTAGVGAGNGFGELAGGAGNDTFVIDGTGYRIFGGAHDGSAEAGFTDVIRARGDNAVIGLNHVEGIETITADGYSNVTIEGTSGNDTLNLGNVAIVGINSINLGAGTADYIAVNGTLDLSAITLTGVEQIYGLDGNDTITGSVGNDTINGQLGTNTLNGGDGDDTFVYVYRRIGSPTVELMPVDTIDGGSGYDRLVGHTANAGIGITSISGVEEISANGFANVRILGSNNAETFDFTGVRAVNLTHTALHGGDDTVILGHTAGVGAGNGFGELAGGAGNDTFVIDGIGYRIFGGAHDGSAEAGFTDVIRARGDNAVIGLNHVSGIETITADGYSNVTIEGTSGNDTLNLGNTSIIGINAINLGAGNDTITGSAAAEVINGGSGADLIVGRGGADILSGGLDNDTFRFDALTDSAIGSSDLIVDFATGDRINLSLIDASASAAGDQAFSLIGSAAFSNVAGQLRYDLGGDGNTHIYGDTNADSVADLYIVVAGHRTMAAGDFVL